MRLIPRNIQSLSSESKKDLILNFKATKLASIFMLIAFNTITIVHAQDVHFSQFDRANLSINPALIANGEQSVRYSLQVKNQWREGLGLPYSTKQASLEQKIRPCTNSTKHKLSYGINLINDNAGDSRINLNSVSGAFAYTYQYVEEISFTVGLIGSYNNRSFDISQLTWPEFWNDLGFIENNSSSSENFSNDVLNYGSIGAGFNFYGKQSKQINEDGTVSREGRSTLNFGVGVFNINRPELNFYNESNTSPSVKLGVRYSLYMVPVIEVGQKMDLKFKVFSQFQNTYFESLVNGGIIRHFKGKGKPYSLGLSLGARIWSLDNKPSLVTGEKKKLVDSFIPEFTASFRNWDFGFSFDITTSKFALPTNRRGGPEFFIRKNIYNCIQQPPYKPNCRIF